MCIKDNIRIQGHWSNLMYMVCITAYSAEATFPYTVTTSPGFLERYDKNTVGLSIPDSIGDFP